MGSQDSNGDVSTAPSHTSTAGKVLSLAYGPEPLQFGKLYVPVKTGPHPVVILIHGGFWRAAYGLELMTKLARDLVKRGIAVWNIEYRRVGDAGGGWPGTLTDSARATDYLRDIAPTYALDIQRVITVGHSAGGHLSFWLAARPRMAQQHPQLENEDPLGLIGAISLAGVVDLKQAWRLHLGSGAAGELLGGSPKEVPERYNAACPSTFLPLGVPQILIHGTRDKNVPLSISESYYKKALKAGDQAELTILPDLDHFALIDPSSSAWTTTVGTVRKLFDMEH